LQKAVADKSYRLQGLFSGDAKNVKELFSDVSECEVVPDKLPSRSVCDKVLDDISAAYGEAMSRSPGIEELWPDSDFWQHSAIDGLSIPLGWSRDGTPVNLDLGRPGGTGIHTLVAGRPGSGKSSLLHVLLHSLCHRYSPAEVRVMLLDYKQGVEMAMYASPVLPHADLVAMDSDVSYGVTVLEYLRDEIERRAKLFQEAKKTSLDQYNRNCDASDRLPRILLLIDEFQVLFAEDRATTTDVESLLISLLRQGRAYGIHILLCTQTLSGLTNISLTQLTALIAERICLACDAQDSAKTLSSGNEAGSRLSGPPEAILNSSNGSKDANRLFIFPEPIVAACQQHLLSLSQNAAKAGFASSARLFRGDEAVTLPPTEFFDANARRPTDPCAVIGQALSFDAGPLVIPWPARLGGHVLVTGPSPAIRDGVVAALVRSLASLDKPLAVTLYDVRANPLWQSIKANSPEVLRFSLLPEDWDGDFAKIPVLKPGDLGVFIIDGLDQDRLLKNAAIWPRTTTPPTTPTMSVIEFLESAHKKGWRVIATADNWRRLDTPDRKDLLNEFQIRIGFQMSDDDAARMTFNAARSFGISGNQDRAIYFDQHANRLERFRPFVLEPKWLDCPF
jgi:S-DNA-T family DNA segregation ATPase FtsK/SpoIIIE